MLSLASTLRLLPASAVALKISQRFVHSHTFHSRELLLHKLGIQDKLVHRNLPYDQIFTHEQNNGEVIATSPDNLQARGVVGVFTGEFTGRSPKDKYIVQCQETEKKVNWASEYNNPISPEHFEHLKKLTLQALNASPRLYVFDGYVGYRASRRKLRVVTQTAWQHHFAMNMFIRPKKEELQTFTPDFTVLSAPFAPPNPLYKQQHLHSGHWAAFDIPHNLGVIGGLHYAGEIKKGMFAMMNYWLPNEGVLPMHCSANVSDVDGSSALFFGLSGTGKTTLSADPSGHRLLVGDDEHGWDEEGVFNLEGGCYAKVIKLRFENEPDIWLALKRNAILENVVINSGVPDYDDIRLTENSRASYPIDHIRCHHPSGVGGHPSAIIFLVHDTFSVLPPIAKLDVGGAMYHYLSGYTAKVSGTERGIKEPTPTFSPCFAEPFLVHHPTHYAEILGEKLARHKANAYLINTGFAGGAYPEGKRMPISITRDCVEAVLDGQVEKAAFDHDPLFNFKVPRVIPRYDQLTPFLHPISMWENKEKFHKTAVMLAQRFVKNFHRFSDSPLAAQFEKYGPILPKEN